MVGFPSLAPGSMVAAWRSFSGQPVEPSIMFSYKGVFNVPTDIFADLVYGDLDAIEVSWKKPQGYAPNAYSVYRSEEDQAYTQVSSQVYDVKYIDDGLNGASYYKYKVKAIEGAEESDFSSVSNALYPGEDFMVDYMEGFEGITYNEKIGTSNLTWGYDTVNQQQGLQSLELVYTYAGSGWGAVMPASFPTVIDLSGYDTVSVWVNSGVAGNAGVAIQFFETGRPEGNETWSSSSPIISNAGWQKYQFSLSDFGRTTEEKNNHFDRESIGGYQLFFSDATANGTYWVDKIELHRPQPLLDVTPSSIDFGGTIAGSPSNHRFQTAAINIKYGGFGTPWTIRVWTNNSEDGEPEPEKSGMRGKPPGDTNLYIPLKIWCSNYGPGSYSPPPGPDEENNYFWGGYDFNNDGDKDDSITSGSFAETSYGFDINGDGVLDDTIYPSTAQPLTEEPSWLRVPEKDEMDPNNVYTWRRLCWNDGMGYDAGLGWDFDIYLAIDTAGTKPQDYGTILTIEYLNQ